MFVSADSDGHVHEGKLVADGPSAGEAEVHIAFECFCDIGGGGFVRPSVVDEVFVGGAFGDIEGFGVFAFVEGATVCVAFEVDGEVFFAAEVGEAVFFEYFCIDPVGDFFVVLGVADFACASFFAEVGIDGVFEADGAEGCVFYGSFAGLFGAVEGGVHSESGGGGEAFAFFVGFFLGLAYGFSVAAVPDSLAKAGYGALEFVVVFEVVFFLEFVDFIDIGLGFGVGRAGCEAAFDDPRFGLCDFIAVEIYELERAGHSVFVGDEFFPDCGEGIEFGLALIEHSLEGSYFFGGSRVEFGVVEFLDFFDAGHHFCAFGAEFCDAGHCMSADATDFIAVFVNEFCTSGECICWGEGGPSFIEGFFFFGLFFDGGFEFFDFLGGYCVEGWFVFGAYFIDIIYHFFAFGTDVGEADHGIGFDLGIAITGVVEGEFVFIGKFVSGEEFFPSFIYHIDFFSACAYFFFEPFDFGEDIVFDRAFVSFLEGFNFFEHFGAVFTFIYGSAEEVFFDIGDRVAGDKGEFGIEAGRNVSRDELRPSWVEFVDTSEEGFHHFYFFGEFGYAVSCVAALFYEHKNARLESLFGGCDIAFAILASQLHIIKLAKRTFLADHTRFFVFGHIGYVAILEKHPPRFMQLVVGGYFLA